MLQKRNRRCCCCFLVKRWLEEPQGCRTHSSPAAATEKLVKHLNSCFMVLGSCCSEQGVKLLLLMAQMSSKHPDEGCLALTFVQHAARRLQPDAKQQ